MLCAKAALRSGAGLVTVHTPKCGYTVLQSTVPEAMLETDVEERHLSTLPKDMSRYSAIGIGPGIGLHEQTAEVLMNILHTAHQPIVLDADALNLFA